jgi:hypothetical protein
MSMRTIERWTEVTSYSAETIATRVIIKSGEYIVMTYIDGHHQERGDLSYGHPVDAIDMAKVIRDNAESEVN